MRYQVLMQPSVLKTMARFPANMQKRLFEKLDGLAFNPRPAGIKALQGDYPGYRLRVGDYRALYTVADQNKTVIVYDVGQRSDIYR